VASSDAAAFACCRALILGSRGFSPQKLPLHRPAASGERMNTPAVGVTLCVLRLGEPLDATQVLTRSPCERFPLRFQFRSRPLGTVRFAASHAALHLAASRRSRPLVVQPSAALTSGRCSLGPSS
jgi:hypothetical protein